MNAESAIAKNVEPLLQRAAASLEKGLVPVEIFNDEAVFAAEMDRIFTNCWMFVAHETEIPGVGDFVQRRIGLDPVIVTRDVSGGINVLSNYCRHRGTQVCQTDVGNARVFKCSYHGWAYSNTGDLIGTPHGKEAYGEPLDRRKWGLFRAPRVATRHGFIFASLAAEGPSLDDYLGGAGWMLDLIVGLHPEGMKVAGPPERYKMRADWKTAAENFSGDAYHVDVAHWSLEQIKMAQGLRTNTATGILYEFEGGHAFQGSPWTKIVHPGYLLWGYPPEVTEKFDLSGLDAAQQQVANLEPPTVGNIFPNLSVIRVNIPATPGSPMSVFTSFRQWQPLGPGELELWNWQFVWTFQSEEDALQSATNGQFAFGSAGLFEQDDTVNWEGAQRAAKSPWALKQGMELHLAQADDSAVDQLPDPTWTGPGIRRNTAYGEHNQLHFYRHWLKTMRTGATSAHEIAGVHDHH